MTRLPDFIVIGAPRCGTTSLARWLGAHPDIAIPEVKEVRYFNLNYHRGVDWYARHFDADAPIVGEASPQYLADEATPDRIAQVCPEAKLIASLRDPVERLWSHYLLMKNRGKERRPFEDLIGPESPYVEASRYGKSLARFSEFPLHVILFDDLLARPEATFGGILDFLGARHVSIDQVGERYNGYVSFRHPGLQRMSEHWPQPAKRLVGRLNKRSSEQKPELIDPRDRERLLRLLRDDIAVTEDILGMPVPWRPEESSDPVARPGDPLRA